MHDFFNLVNTKNELFDVIKICLLVCCVCFKDSIVFNLLLLIIKLQIYMFFLKNKGLEEKKNGQFRPFFLGFRFQVSGGA